jgi:hypothetical protein
LSGDGIDFPSSSGEHSSFRCSGFGVPVAVAPFVLEAGGFLLPHPILVHMVSIPFSQVHLQYKLYPKNVVKDKIS